MKSYKARTSAFVLFGMILAAPLAFADKKEDLYNRGTAAVNSGDAIAAKAAFCQLAGEDEGYKDAKAQCATYTGEAQRQLNRYNQNYLEGVQAMQEGKYDAAEFKFKNVKAGDRVPDAKQKIAEIAKLKQDKANADAAAKNSADQEAQMKGKLDQGVSAYNTGDYSSAKNLLGGVTGSHQGEAQAYLTKIRNYEGKMAEAAADAANKNYSGAAAAYTEAVRMNPSGPGDPLSQVQKMNQLAASASATPAPATTASNPPPPVVKPAVSKDVVKTIDIARYLQDGKRALAKGDFKQARRYFSEVLGQDSRNQEAADGMAELKAKDTAQGNASDDDPLLAAAIRKFYEGTDYQEVEFRLNNYIYNGLGKKLGLANFYAGASIMTRYYLAGASDQGLKNEARKKFTAAKGVDGFKVPDKLVSPKILREFESTPKAGS